MKPLSENLRLVSGYAEMGLIARHSVASEALRRAENPQAYDAAMCALLCRKTRMEQEASRGNALTQRKGR